MTRKASEITFKQPDPLPPRPIVESVWIPLLISLVTGLLLTGFAVLGVQVLWETWWPWTWAAFMFAGVSLGVWILQNWDVLLWEAEERVGVDLDRDGVIGDPNQRYVLVNAAPPEEVERPVDRAHRRMCQFVRDAEQSTAARDLEEKNYSRDEIKMFRELLIRGKWAVWRNPANNRDGWRLTRPVGVILAAIE